MKDFLAIADYSPADLQAILDQAVALKKEWKEGGNPPLFKNKVLAMIFQKPSLRTRVSFDMAMRHLGGDALYLSPAEIGLGKRESIADVARVVSGYVDAVMARVFDHQHVLELAKWADIPIINGLSDYNHPCQAAADALTIQENFGPLKGLQVTYIGDGNNVCHSLLLGCAKVGIHMRIATPPKYGPAKNIVQLAKTHAKETGAEVMITHSPQDAVKKADIIYSDVWVSMGQEEESDKRLSDFNGYQINEKLTECAAKDFIFMHCLPAHRGQEVTAEIIDGEHSIVFDQAENRLHTQKAILISLLGEKP